MSGPSEGVAYFKEQLPASAIFVAISLSASEGSHQQGDEETDGAQPRIDDIEKAHGEVCGGDDPQIVAPFFLFRFHNERVSIFNFFFYSVHDARRAGFDAEAATYTCRLIDDGIASLVDADGLTWANLGADTASHTSVYFILGYILTHIVHFV